MRHYSRFGPFRFTRDGYEDAVADLALALAWPGPRGAVSAAWR